MRRIIRGAALAGTLFTLAAALASGCAGREFGEVEGTVALDGKPLPDVEVMFVPDVATGNKGNNASGFTDAQGRYKLRSERDKRDGTVLGSHRVIVIDLTTVPDLTGAASPGQPARPSGPGLPMRFPKEYADLERTPFKNVEVKPGKQTLDFDVKGGRR